MKPARPLHKSSRDGRPRPSGRAKLDDPLQRKNSLVGKCSRKSSTHELKGVATAGYSGTPLPKKLGIRENYSVALINAPSRFERKLEPLPDRAQIVTEADGANMAVLFAASQADLLRDFRPLAKALPEKAALWIAWPKQTSGIATDLKENVVREFGLDAGWVDYKVCAIDETWSGLCFARRRPASLHNFRTAISSGFCCSFFALMKP